MFYSQNLLEKNKYNLSSTDALANGSFIMPTMLVTRRRRLRRVRRQNSELQFNLRFLL